jgi:hypothetical protein
VVESGRRVVDLASSAPARLQLNVARPTMDFLVGRLQERGLSFTASVADALALLRIADEARAAGDEIGVRRADGEFLPVHFQQP